MTKKEIIENGWVEKYVLGLTTEEESSEVERLASLYPEIQDSINTARNKICSKFNRSLTQPALRNSFMNKRKMMILTVTGVSLFSLGFCFLCREHFSLKKEYSARCVQLAQEQAKVNQLASATKLTSEHSCFLHSPDTRRIRLKGCDAYPDAEVVIFQDVKTGKMMLRIVDLPELKEGNYYEVWTQQDTKPDRLIGLLKPPLSYDSLYTMEPTVYSSGLVINSIDSVTHQPLPICLASLSN